MLYVSLVLSLVLLLLVNGIVARSKQPVPGSLFCCLGFALGPGCVMLYFPAVMWQAGLLSVLLFILLVPNRGRRLYRPLSCVVTVIAYCLLLQDMWKIQQEFAELREQFPYESLEGRLPVLPTREKPALADPKQLDSLENEIEHEAWGSRPFNSRANALQHIHEKSVDRFVDSAGFGIGRMGIMNRHPERHLHNSSDAEVPPIPQPDYLNPFVESVDGGDRDLPLGKTSQIRLFHDLAVIDFVNPLGFGFIKDRQHVAGFQPHRMTKVPEAEAPWKVARVDLIGLLLHEGPVVYISANLPRMSELGTAPTRPLDAFESEGLKSLQTGEELFVRGTGQKARMVGAIRSTKQCLGCHGGERGELLGAFSYGLRSDGR